MRNTIIEDITDYCSEYVNNYSKNKDPTRFGVDRIQNSLKTIARALINKVAQESNNEKHILACFKCCEIVVDAVQTHDKEVMICAFLNINRILKEANK